MKVFKAGDKIRCINLDGWVASTECQIGNIYTIQAYDKKDRLSLQLCEDKNGYFLSENSFELVESAEEEQPITNANVKMITTFVPTWARWMAMDASGSWIVSSSELKPNIRARNWDKITPKTKICKVGWCDITSIQVDWKETLHEV